MRGIVLKSLSKPPKQSGANWTIKVQFFSFGLALVLSSPNLLQGQVQSPVRSPAQASGDQSPAFQSPRSAMLHSAVFPGWGQWRNGQRFKAVLVFGGEAALAVNAAYLNQRAVRTRGDERAFYEDNRSLSIWWLFGVYFLNILDAYVDAQLRFFDTSTDLSSKVSSGGASVFGLQLKIPLGR
jgi:hypothetical protein